MKGKLISGVLAALGTPRHPDGAFNQAGFRNSIEFLLRRGIRGFAINGATGEFCLTSRDELRQMLQIARDTAGTTGKIVCGIGAASLSECLERGRIAMESGAQCLLLPMPFFFPYGQDDLREFCVSVANALQFPLLLYNLPQFTSGLDPDTVLQIRRESPYVIGIKDSSGSLAALRALADDGADSCRILGSDDALPAAMDENVIDGVISGVAGVFPEIILAVYRNDGHAAQARKQLSRVIEQLGPFPVPWALKVIAELRGITAATFPLPVSARREKQLSEFRKWAMIELQNHELFQDRPG